MDDTPMSRIKFILEDGRKVYSSKRGKITLAPTTHALKLAGNATKAAYSKDLSLFASPEMFKQLGQSYVKVLSVEVEDASLPEDIEATIAGGK